MPIRIPDHLPARKVLEAEGVNVMDSTRAARQDIRPLQIGLLNLMPNKQRTETQFARLIGATPLQVDLTLIRISDHKSKNTSEAYLKTFYQRWEDVRRLKFDGFIVTGAPIAHLPFEEVRYWPEMVEIMDWTQTNVHSPLFICWGVQAALYHFHGVTRRRRAEKAVGIYRHQNIKPRSPYLRGFSDDFAIPVSRYNDIDRDTLPADGSLEVLIDSDEVGICMLEDHKYRALYMLNHFEYDNNSLADEYARDAKAGLDPALPVNYFPDNDPAKAPLNTWRATAHLFFQNWINEIYQSTPYDMDMIGTAEVTGAAV
ncbi:MAG TPA: homoserine O-succinyltransferase [Devosiaceae bacterium]